MTVPCALQESTCQQVQQCMQHGAEKLLQKLFNDYLLLRLDTKQRFAGKGKSKGAAAANGPASTLPVGPNCHLQWPVITCMHQMNL